MFLTSRYFFQSPRLLYWKWHNFVMLHRIVPDVGWPDWRQTKCLRLQPLRDQSIKSSREQEGQSLCLCSRTRSLAWSKATVKAFLTIMLLCCFREPKKSSPTSTSALTKDGSAGPIKADAYRKSSQRPLNLSLSSKEADDISEILVVHQHNHHHHKPYSHPRGHSICSLTSDRSSRPPSRDGSDRRTEARAPLPAKEAKRLKKQKSQESFKENYKSVTSIPYIDATPPSSTGLGLGLTNSVTPSHRPYPAASAGKVHLTIGYCIAPKISVEKNKKCPQPQSIQGVI